MNQEITFGSDGNNDYLPALSDGANVKLKILTAPEKYETLYGEKIKLDIEVTGINTKCEGIVVNQHYTVSSSAKCWQELHASYINPPQAIMNKNNMEMTPDVYRDAVHAFIWQLTAKATASGKTHYKLSAIEQEWPDAV